MWARAPTDRACCSATPATATATSRRRWSGSRERSARPWCELSSYGLVPPDQPELALVLGPHALQNRSRRLKHDRRSASADREGESEGSRTGSAAALRGGSSCAACLSRRSSGRSQD